MRHKTEWTCARCGLQEETDYGQTPDGWVTGGYNTQPLSVKSGSSSSYWKGVDDLCNPCGGYLVDFIHGNERESIARDEEVREILSRITQEES